VRAIEDKMVIPAVMPSYARADIAFERGEGAWLTATDGRRFLDFASGIAVTALGHNHPHLVRTLTEQAGKLWHCSNLFRIPDQERLAERLVANSFADTVFFANSGAEATEGGMKLIRKYHDVTGNPDRYRIVAFEGSFHGRTLAGISAGANKAHQAGFGPLVDAFDHVAFGNLNEVRDAIGPETAAILVEPVQGEGGIRPADPAFLRGLREACDEYGLLLFFDEVQTGMGRTGKLFAYEWSGIAPDVMTLAKGLGGGFPVAAILATEKAAQGIGPGSHGSTFGGNPLAMAVANAVLDVMLEDGFLANVRVQGEALQRRVGALVAAAPKVADAVRGLGLLVGIHCVAPAGEVVAALRAEGLLTVPAADNVVRLLPPLIVGGAELDAACGMIESAFAKLSS
jgi:acetylornithine/N-succinyldiaminopimelate aminotransferase